MSWSPRKYRPTIYVDYLVVYRLIIFIPSVIIKTVRISKNHHQTLLKTGIKMQLNIRLVIVRDHQISTWIKNEWMHVINNLLENITIIMNWFKKLWQVLAWCFVLHYQSTLVNCTPNALAGICPNILSSVKLFHAEWTIDFVTSFNKRWKELNKQVAWYTGLWRASQGQYDYVRANE